MFCLKKLSGEPAESAKLRDTADFGYKINGNNQIINDATSSFLTSEDLVFPAQWDSPEKQRHAILKQESLREAIRYEIYKRLSSSGVNPVYLSGDLGTVVSTVKPDGKHIPIWVSKDLKEKRSVVLLVGEHTHEPAIFSWFRALREPGLNRATAIGIMKLFAEKKAELKQHSAELITGKTSTKLTNGNGVSKDGSEKTIFLELDNEVDPATLAVKTSVAMPENKRSFEESLQDPEIPGIILLNPGQLLYSHHHNRTFTQDAWLARVREVDQVHGYKIDEEHNLVAGHKRSEEHVDTFCTAILPQLVRHVCKIFVIGIGDGADSVISCIAKQLREPEPDTRFLADHVVTMALLDPPAGQLDDIDILKERGIDMSCYRISDETAGSIVDVPDDHPFLLGEMKRLSKDERARYGSLSIKVGKYASKKFIEAYNKTCADKMVKVDDENEENGTDGKANAVQAQCLCLEQSAGPDAHYTESILPLLMEDILESFSDSGMWVTN